MILGNKNQIHIYTQRDLTEMFVYAVEIGVRLGRDKYLEDKSLPLAEALDLLLTEKIKEFDKCQKKP
jgi:hypothetical protein